MIVFTNKGEIDPRAVTSFGVSAKTEGAIGFFGTGLKYAIAILLRTGHSITIWSGTKRMDFGTRKEKIRGKTFEFITLNRRRCEFTTEVGKTWEVWQAFRELYCNCIDEGGECSQAEGNMAPAKGTTQIVVSGKAFEETYRDRGRIVLATKPLYATLYGEIHPGPSKWVYYRGIQAYQLPLTAKYTYNIVACLDLTEDRTLKHSWSVAFWIKDTIKACQNKEVLLDVLTASDSFWEKTLCYDGDPPCKEFAEVVAPLAQAYDARLNVSALTCCRMSVASVLAKAEQMDLGELETRRIERALAFCDRLGYPVREYPLVVTDHLGKEVLGRAHDGKIYLSRRALMQGTKVVAGTILEEFLHLRHGLDDESRGMQNFLLDALVSLGERITGDPL